MDMVGDSFGPKRWVGDKDLEAYIKLLNKKKEEDGFSSLSKCVIFQEFELEGICTAIKRHQQRPKRLARVKANMQQNYFVDTPQRFILLYNGHSGHWVCVSGVFVYAHGAVDEAFAAGVPVRAQQITVYDPLHEDGTRQKVNEARAFVEGVFAILNIECEFREQIRNLFGTQPNGYDCGVYSLIMARNLYFQDYRMYQIPFPKGNADKQREHFQQELTNGELSRYEGIQVLFETSIRFRDMNR